MICLVGLISFLIRDYPCSSAKKLFPIRLPLFFAATFLQFGWLLSASCCRRCRRCSLSRHLPIPQLPNPALPDPCPRDPASRELRTRFQAPVADRPWVMFPVVLKS